MFSKKTKSALAILLSAVMIFGMIPAMAFADDGGAAEDDEKVNLLVIGNSTSNGYRMPDFQNDANGFSTHNNDIYDEDANPGGAWTVQRAEEEHMGKISTESYPWRLKKEIANERFNGDLSKVNLTSLALNGMRTDELRAFLDEDFYNASAEREWRNVERYLDEHGYQKTTVPDQGLPGHYYWCPKGQAYSTSNRKSEWDCRGFLNAHMDWYLGNFADKGSKGGCTPAISEKSYGAARAYVQKSIKDADVIVVDVAGNNFGTYMGYRISAFLGLGNEYASANIYENLDDVQGLPDSIRSRLKSIKKTVQSQYPMLAGDAGEQLLDSFLYGAADCMANTNIEMDWINRNKKEGAKVILVGLTNMMEGLEIDNGGQKIDFGQIAGLLYNLVNTYMKVLDTNADNYYFVDIFGGYTTFASSIKKADTFTALLSDGNGKDGKGKYAIDMMYDGFLTSFIYNKDTMGDVPNSLKPRVAEQALGYTTYGMICDGITAVVKKSLGNNAQVKFAHAWTDGDFTDQSSIPFTIKDLFVTFDSSKFAEATMGIGYSTDSQIGSLTSPPANLTGDLFQQLIVIKAGTEMGISINEMMNPTNYNYVDSQLSDKDRANIASQLYVGITQGITAGVQNVLSGAAVTFNYKTAEELVAAGNNPLKFDIGPLYATYDSDLPLLEGGISYTTSETAEHVMTKGMIISEIIKPAIEELLYDAVHSHNTLSIDYLVNVLGGTGGMAAVSDSITTYLTKKMTGTYNEETDNLDEGIWGLLVIEVRFLLYDGVGEHPNLSGCNEKYQKVLAAYKSDKTSYTEAKEELEAILEEIRALLKGTPVGDDIDKIVELLGKAEDAMAMMDTAQATLAEINEYRKELNKYYKETLDLLGITEEDLIAQGKFIADNVDIEQVAKWIVKMNEIAQKSPELYEKYSAILERYADEIYDFVNETLDELIKNKDKIDKAIEIMRINEILQTTKDILRMAQDMYNNRPTQDEVRERLLARLEKLQAIVEEKAKEISDDLYQQIKEIGDRIREATGKDDYEQIIEDLKPIFEQMTELGLAIYQLPEYEKLIDSYSEVIETLAEDAASLKGDVSGLMDSIDLIQEELDRFEQQTEDDSDLIAKLTAKTIKVNIASKVTFPKSKVKVEISWEKDPDAAGYEFRLNGDLKQATVTKTGFKYVIKNAKIGQKYNFSVKPYIYKGDTKVYGRDYKKTVVPKVSLKKGKIKKLKVGKKSFTVKWKKVSGASGYQISYKLGKKTYKKTVKGGKKVSLKVKKLKKGKKGKKYIVKVRAWKKVNGKKYYGKWSAGKKVKVK